ncbi:MAG TPA: hypothetical protein VGF58_10425 [Burkholderiales bacterium]|jgi:hypothetical protein
MKPLDMKATAFAFLLCTAAAVSAQTRAPTPEEQAFARLPRDIQQMLSNMTPAQAMQAIAQTEQHSIALGNPQPGQDQFRSTLGALLASPNSTYVSGSAGATTFPPLSPLVAPPPPPFLR